MPFAGAGEAVALLDATGATLSYDALGSTLAACDAAVARSGLSGARIATLLPDTPGTLVLLLALMRRARVLPLSPGLTQAELRTTLDGAGIDVLLTPHGAETDGLDGIAPRRAQVTVGGLDQVPAMAASLRISGQGGATGEPPGLVLFTSGTTSQPKRVPLGVDALLISARAIAGHLKLGPGDRAVHMLPMFHVGALVDLCLAPLLSGGSVCLAHPMSPAATRDAVLDRGATWMQAVPTMMHALMADLDPATARAVGQRLRFVRSVSSDLAPALQQAFSDRFGGVAVVQMYGMTESAGQIASNPVPPAAGRPGSVGRIAGPEVCIMDTLGNPLPPGEAGEVCIRGPQVTPGYENADRAANFHGPWLRTGDLGRLDPEGWLWLDGRLKEIINRGGEKIAPTEVERALLDVPGVIEAVACAMPHPTLGEVPAAVVVTADGVDPDGLRPLLAQRLAPWKVPVRIRAVPGLPRLRSGKLDRRAAAALLDTGPVRAAEPLGAQAATIAAVWARVLGTERPGPDDDFFDMGGDSLSAATFCTALETRLGRDLPVDLLYRAPTLRDLDAAIAAHVGPAYRGPLPPRVFRAMRRQVAGSAGRKLGPASLVSRWSGAGTGVPLLWSGGDSAMMRDLLGPDRPFYELRSLTGLSVKSDRNTGLLADHYAGELADLLPAGGYVIGGFCQGAVLTRALAERLAARGVPPALFLTMDRHFADPFHAAPALCVWSQSTQFSAAKIFTAPELALSALYPLGAAPLRMPMPHLDMLEPGPMRQVLAAADRLVSRPPEPGPASAVPPVPRARLRFRAPRMARAGGMIAVDGRVTGLPPGGAPRVGARWKNLDLHHRDSHAGSTRPGPDGLFRLELPVPRVRIPLFLELDLVCDGFFWASDAGGRARRRLVIVR